MLCDVRRRPNAAKPVQLRHAKQIAAGSGTAMRTLSIPMISSGDGSMALSSTQRSTRLAPGFQVPLNDSKAFEMLVTPTVFGTMGCDEGPAPTGISVFTAANVAPLSRL